MNPAAPPMKSPVAPPPAGKPPTPPTGKPPAPPIGKPPTMDASHKAAQAMIDAHNAQKGALVAMIPPAAPEGYEVGKIQHIVSLLNEIAQKFAPPGSAKALVWTAPKGKFLNGPFPKEVFIPTVGLLMLVQKLLPPDLAAKLAVDPGMFGSNAGLDAVVARLATLLANKNIETALMSAKPMPAAEPPAPKPPHPEPDADQMGGPSDADADDMTAAGAKYGGAST